MPTTQIAPESHLPRFGLRAFRPGQREVIAAVLDGADCLCIMPTGGGKSLCYQLPAVAREGVVLVVSPLIALMKDQVDALRELDIRAALINSTLAPSEQAARMADLAAGRYDLMYVAPERFRSPQFIDAIRRTRVQLLAVDEAHCISEWGHDFRHDYSRLGDFRRRLGNPQTIALTATATAEVREDVSQQLALQSPQTFVAGFARPNLHYEVQSFVGKREKEEGLIRFLRQTPGAGIIYTATRKGCVALAAAVAKNTGRTSGVYHGGLPSDERRQVQESFMSDRIEVVAATNAFGMGIDKADVRFVVHYNIPGSLEAYYQEAGRSGRDGQPARCLLLYSSADRYIQEFFIDSACPPPETIAEVYEYLRSHEQDPIELTQQDLRDELELPISAEGVGTCERLLEKCGVLRRLEPHRNMAAVRLDSDLPSLVDLLPAQAKVKRKIIQAIEKQVGDRRFELVYFRPEKLAATLGIERAALARTLRELNKLEAFDYVPPFRGRAVHMLRRDQDFDDLDIDFETLERRRQSDYEKLECVVRFANTSGCRQEQILRYFGERSGNACGNCDNCRGRRAATSTTVVEADEGLKTAVVMVLSGAARAGGRFGKQLIAGMLCGSRSSKIARWKLDRLSTFGLLAHLTQPEVILLIDELLAVGLLEQSDIDRFRPVVRLTERGDQVMRGQAALEEPLALPDSLVRKLHLPGRPRAADRDEFQVRESGGECALDQVAHEPSVTRGPAAEDVQPSHYWTWRLLRDGYSVSQCCEIRRLEPEVVLDHALRAVENGLQVEPNWLLSSTQLQALESAVQGHSPDRLRPVMAQLPPDLTRQHVQLFLKCRSPGQ